MSHSLEVIFLLVDKQSSLTLRAYLYFFSLFFVYESFNKGLFYGLGVRPGKRL